MTWHAIMIRAAEPYDDAPRFRQAFSLDRGHGAILRACLRVTALGVVEPTINGLPATDALLTPGWSSYEWRLRYTELDVKALLAEDSVLGLTAARGWYAGHLGWTGAEHLYGESPAVLAELTIEFADGHIQTVATDDKWSAGPSAVTSNDLYDGQTIDARLLHPGWDRPGASEDGWGSVRQVPFDVATLEPYIGPPVRRQQDLEPVAVFQSPKGRTIVDFGQNVVGWVRMRVQGDPGAVITLRHAEVLDDGELGTRPLRGAQATDRYVLSGGQDVFEPTFTFHGFRFVEITGWPGAVSSDLLTAVVIGTDLERTGTFECSDPLLTQLHRNVVWGMRGNFIDVPTDCPQRDERLGWTGDLSVFAPTASFLYDVKDFLRDWLRDLSLEQRHHDGVVPYVVPDVLKRLPLKDRLGEMETTAIWSDAAVWVPWALWTAYGDLQVLHDQYESMSQHVRRIERLLSPTGVWDTGFQFGDWLDPDSPPSAPGQAKADPAVVATACAFRSAVMVRDAAALLGHTDDADHFSALAQRLRGSFNQHYVRAGKIKSDCATVYALAIHFGLIEGGERVLAGERLARSVVENGYRISTGFAGTPFVADALTTTGHLEVAYRLVQEREMPSWLYPVSMGATTIWERWDSMLPDGTINPGEMTSFNHYALGAIADWMHRVIGGLAPEEPGYRKVLVHPRPGGDITSASTTLSTKYGLLGVNWRSTEHELHLAVQVPEGVTALVRRDGEPDLELLAGTHQLVSRTMTLRNVGT